jgi:hypothetical protein
MLSIFSPEKIANITYSLKVGLKALSSSLMISFEISPLDWLLEVAANLYRRLVTPYQELSLSYLTIDLKIEAPAGRCFQVPEHSRQ